MKFKKVQKRGWEDLSEEDQALFHIRTTYCDKLFAESRPKGEDSAWNMKAINWALTDYEKRYPELYPIGVQQGKESFIRIMKKMAGE